MVDGQEISEEDLFRVVGAGWKQYTPEKKTTYFA